MYMDNVIAKKPARGLAPGFLKGGWFWTVARWSTLAAMAGTVTTAWGRRGIQGVDVPDPLMYTNLGNLAFWVLWLMGIVLLVPLAGRAWCSVCPVGAVNEFASRFGLKMAFPRSIRNQHPKALALVITLLLMGLFRIHHYPEATAWYLLAWAAAAVMAGILFAGRSLCAYLCPVGGMLGLYGRTAPLCFGVREDKVCRDCENRECVRGAVSWLTAGFGRLKLSLRMRKNPCPVNLRVWDMDGTDRCLMCFNCMRVCPLDNVALFGRKPLASLWKESYPRFSDAVLTASLMGFILLTFSRFWPPVQGLITLPVKWLGPYIGTASRPLFLVWLGIGLPLLTVLISAAFVVWSRTNSAVAVFPGDIIPEKVPPGGPDARKGLTMTGLPVKVWLEEAHSPPAGDPSGEEKIMSADTVRGLSAVYAPSIIPLLLSSHLVLALVKLNTKLAYLPVAAADPAGVRSYMAIWELDLMSQPGVWFTMGTVKAVSLALLFSGTALSLWTYSRISRREGRGALPMLLPLVVLAVVVYGGFYNWLF
jgi:polyferredoxin